MSDFKWSDEQKLAIESTSSNILLSAGAGSGKTAVLTERIYQLVKNGADLSRFLVLTFTKAASEEMRGRIRKRIYEDPSLGDYSSKIESAHIETFDSFALFIVKKYSLRLGVSPNIGILDQSLFSIKRNTILNDILTHLYLEKNSDLLELISHYCTKNDEKVRSFILLICENASSSLDKEAFFNTFIDKYYDENRLKEYVNNEYDSIVYAIKVAIRKAEELEDIDDSAAIINFLDEIIKNCPDFDSLAEYISRKEFKFPTKPKTKTNDAAYREGLKDYLKPYFNSAKAYGTTAEIIEQYMLSKKDMQIVLEIAKEVEDKLDQYKKEKNLYVFNDIANLALKALSIPDIKKEMSEYFQYILVDEYQDTSILQEMVINQLERNNVCMVGDIKQSIYRFRGADCRLFQDKYIKYKDHKGGELINLNTSYRSRKEIVNVVNEMFGNLMTRYNNPIDYSDGHIFKYGFTDYDSLKDPKENYDLCIYKYQLEKNVPFMEKEIDVIARDIIDKIQRGYKVFDNNKNTMRECSFKDFAILLSKGVDFDDIKQGLSNRGIPVQVIYKETITSSEIYAVLKNLLVLFDRCSEEEYDDVFKHSFVSISRSFIMRKKDQEIYETVKSGKYSETDLFKKIQSVVNKHKYSSLNAILNGLIDEFEVYQNINRIKNFSSNANKVELIVNLSKQMDQLGMSLQELISYFDDINKFDLEIEYVDKDVNEDSVIITTIHSSKGLEYPIVYLPGLTYTSKSGGSSAFMFDEYYGPSLPDINDNAKTSLVNHLIKRNEARGQYEEKLRVFYVAVTRAREKLIMLYGEKENSIEEIYDPLQATTFHKMVSYLCLQYKYGVEPVLKNLILKKNYRQREGKNIELKNISVKPIELEKKRASKEENATVDKSLLEFGNEIHYLLEITDFEKKDSGFIKDTRMRKYVDNVLKQEIFKNVKNTQVLHEFPFFDERNGLHGVIDCLLIKDDEIDIVDFKLKNLDDEKYVLQLHAYRDYIEQIYKQRIKMYLISAITGEVKEIE